MTIGWVHTLHLSPPIMFGVLSVVSKRFRAVGLIYQQSVEGDSRDPENKKTRSRREEIPRVKSDGAVAVMVPR
ncbi:hypothetical protein A8C20_20370 [Klebsiella pneumoniae]|nr:hypothetical protein [Klebsiella pneumoniae]